VDDFELIVDNFAGGGGASKGIEMGLGRFVDIAVNHDPVAIAMHTVNHPHTRHFCESVWDVDPVKACGGRPVGLAWFSPDCTHFSKAKGGKPVKKHIRGLAWVVLKWAETVKPRVIMLENVEEFVTWGPLIKDKEGNHFPCPKRKGKTFREFVRALKKEGYAVDHRNLRACDYGAPTIRKRLFLIARCDGQPIVWPEPTHGDPKSEAVLSGRLLPWRTAAECIDWSIPAPSIFERKKPLAEATMRRIAKGIMRYVIQAAEPFIVTYYGDKGKGEFRGQGTDEPLATQTTENRHGLVVPFVSSSAYSKTTGRGEYIYPPQEPVRTITASNDKILVAPHLMPLTHQGSDRTNDVKEPFPTVTAAHRGEMAIVAPVMTECANASSPRCMPAEEPLRTICAQTKGGHHALIAPTLVGVGGRAGQSRPRSGDEPLATLTAKADGALVAAFMAKHYGGATGCPIDTPAPTQTARGTQNQVVAASLVRHMGKSVGSDVTEPARTALQGAKDALVTSHLLKLRGTCKDGQPVTEPAPTLTAGGLHIGEVRAFLMKYYGTDQDPNLREPLHTVTTKDRFGLVTVQGQEYQIVDIGMRMLAPRELFRAQGFPDSYIIDRGPDGKPITKTDQVAKCGNSVCPDLAAALVRANVGERVEVAA
jgi:DNA (cytosine-5)-methyltransferase 1